MGESLALNKVKGPKPKFDYPYTYVSSPALANGIVYFVSGFPMQSLYALDANSGAYKWHHEIGNATRHGFASSPSVSGNVIYVGSGDGILHAFNAQAGDSLWGYNLGAPIISSPAIAHGRVYIATCNGTLYCFGLNDTVVDEPEATLPLRCELLQNQPNPFTYKTRISYSVTKEKHTTLEVYNIAGQLVKTLVAQKQKPGYYSVYWNGKDNLDKRVVSGVYFCRLRIGNFVEVKKLVKIR